MILLQIVTTPLSFHLLRGQAAYLAARGVAVHAISAPGEMAAAYVTSERVEHHSIDMRRRLSVIADLRSLLALVQAIRRIRPDIVQSSTPKAGLLGTVAAWLARVPTRIYQVRGLPLLTATGLQARLLCFSEWLACAAASHVLCVSESMRASLIARGLCAPEKARVILAGSSNGVDAEGRFNPSQFDRAARRRIRAELGIPEDALVIGFIGRLVRDKGIVELLDAWRGIRAEVANAHLLVVGPFEPDDAVPEAVANALQSDDRVHLLGLDWDTPRLYAAMTVFCLPSYREGFPNVVLEAGSMGLPVVATHVPGTLDAIEDEVTGTLVEPRNGPALERALLRYLQDDELRASHAAAGRRRARLLFQQERIWEAVHEFYLGTLPRSATESKFARPRSDMPADVPARDVWSGLTPTRVAATVSGCSDVQERHDVLSEPDVTVIQLVTVHTTLGFFRGQFRWLREKGYRVVVGASGGSGLSDMAHAEGIDCVDVPFSRSLDPLRDLRALIYLIRLFRRVQPAIIHAHTPKAGLLGLLAARITGVPLRVYTVHGLPGLTQRGVLRLLLTVSERVAARCATQVLAVSTSVQFELAKIGVRAQVIGNGSVNGVDCDRFDPNSGRWAKQDTRRAIGIRPEQFVALFVGRLCADKGIEDLVEAWKVVRTQADDAILIIAGDLDGRAPLAECVSASLRAEASIRLIGWREDIERWYAAADVLVLPSHREGFPVCVLEAAAMSVPTIAAAAVGSVDAVIDHVTGRLVSVAAVHQLADAILTYYTDRDLLETHGKAARVRALNDFRPATIWEALHSIYSLAKGRAEPPAARSAVG